MEVIFDNVTYLWALVVIPIIIFVHFISLRYSKGRALQFANFIALSRVSKGVGLSSNITILVLRIFVLILIIFAIVGTTLTYNGTSSTVDYALAIDVSASMASEDFPFTRLEAAKESATVFVDSLPFGSSVSIITFSGTSFVDIPLSEDKTQVKDVISGIEVQAIGGTDISNAIITGTNVLLTSKRTKAVVLLTDGKANIGIPQGTAIDYANEHLVAVHTIGIGSSDEVEEVLRIDEDALARIAQSTGGKAYVVDEVSELTGIYESLAVTGEGKKFIDLSLIFIVLALILLLLDWTLLNTIYNRIP
jgi:Ca-activated chloride channel homolog